MYFDALEGCGHGTCANSTTAATVILIVNNLTLQMTSVMETTCDAICLKITKSTEMEVTVCGDELRTEAGSGEFDAFFQVPARILTCTPSNQLF